MRLHLLVGSLLLTLVLTAGHGVADGDCVAHERRAGVCTKEWSHGERCDRGATNGEGYTQIFAFAAGVEAGLSGRGTCGTGSGGFPHHVAIVYVKGPFGYANVYAWEYDEPGRERCEVGASSYPWVFVPVACPPGTFPDPGWGHLLP